MLRLRLDGQTYAYIAKKAGVSRQRIQQVLSPPIPIRDFVVTKYDGRCFGCGLYIGKSGHVHHVNTDGGENYQDIDNLQLLCISCHRKQHPFDCRHNDSFYQHKCLRCGKVWDSLNPHPLRCGKCKSPYWDKEKRND